MQEYSIFPSWESVVQLPITRPRLPIFQERRHKNFQPESDWTKIAFAFNIKKTADFGAKINALGTNPNQNLGDYFTFYADGLATENIEVFENETVTGIYEYLGNNFGYGAQQAFLGYQA